MAFIDLRGELTSVKQKPAAFPSGSSALALQHKHLPLISVFCFLYSNG